MVQRLFVVTSLLLLLTAGWGAWSDFDREWKPYQRRYNRLVLEKIKDEKMRLAIRPEKLEVKQIVVKALGRVDRCVTCHVAFENPAFSDQEEPLRTHPDILKVHPVQKFGCTICHGGQGSATTYRGAAHDQLQFWEEPIWKGEYIQSACGKCHKEASVPGAPALTVARVLYKDEFVCDTCHKLNGEGGEDGPDLTHIGSKPYHAYDFSHVEGPKTKVRWLYEHFLDPESVVPGSEMTNQELTAEQARAMTIMMLSLTDSPIPLEYIVGREGTTAKNGGASSSEADLHMDRPHIYEERGCVLCHTLEGRGGKVGPDLARVAGRRNADWLFLHFKNPRRVVPGTKMPDLHLTDEEANGLTRYILSLKPQK